ncbi:hypothetical protein [Gemella cuniculi]|uniref:hypothetical protein n=1 Tax=Gemella cuniculi TaxID=150240 RepID=UPI00040551A4|nr:hypothetical protein [Gemella cuniculi]
MNILFLLAYWYTYSKWYILGSWFITYIMNIAFKKLWLSPLLINAIALLVLFLGIYFKIVQGKEVGVSFLNVYMPIFFASVVMNLVVYSYRKIKIKMKNR